MKYISLLLIILLVALTVKAQEYTAHFQNESLSKSSFEMHAKSSSGLSYSAIEPSKNKKAKFFLAYEIGEAIFNKFQSLSGEIGVRFNNQHLIRLVHVNLNLSEWHLSSSFAGAVDGDNVEGKQFGFEAFYDFPIIIKGLYLGPSIGYYKNEYWHTILDESIDNSSFSFGTAISYRETDIFKIKGLYYSVSIPMRLNLNPIEKTKLGNATVTNNTFDNSIWLFIGYEF